jgi:hypothetical protein
MGDMPIDKDAMVQALSDLTTAMGIGECVMAMSVEEVRGALRITVYVMPEDEEDAEPDDVSEMRRKVNDLFA